MHKVLEIVAQIMPLIIGIMYVKNMCKFQKTKQSYDGLHAVIYLIFLFMFSVIAVKTGG
jgi:uncharacterized membrane protein YozB (DUF420 family)